jgi:transcription elongation factor GreA-like protein
MPDKYTAQLPRGGADNLFEPSARRNDMDAGDKVQHQQRGNGEVVGFNAEGEVVVEFGESEMFRAHKATFRPSEASALLRAREEA